MCETQSYHANGKLMISGEYLVLSGALALAVPVRYGQRMSVRKSAAAAASLHWTAREKGRIWFKAVFSTDSLQCLSCTQKDTAETLTNILQVARALNASFLKGAYRWDVETDLDFPLQWGLGSSSTLLANVSKWSDTNPYQLLFNSLGGSGYDIACALQDKPLLYQYLGADKQAVVTTVAFRPVFADKLFFVYSGRKQNTRTSLQSFKPERVPDRLVKDVSLLSEHMSSATDLHVFMELMREHERIVALAVRQEPLQEKRFADFNGQLKSLGAWGGDFFLAASDMEQEKLLHYFLSMGCQQIIPFREMVPAST